MRKALSLRFVDEEGTGAQPEEGVHLLRVAWLAEEGPELEPTRTASSTIFPRTLLRFSRSILRRAIKLTRQQAELTRHPWSADGGIGEALGHAAGIARSSPGVPRRDTRWVFVVGFMPAPSQPVFCRIVLLIFLLRVELWSISRFKVCYLAEQMETKSLSFVNDTAKNSRAADALLSTTHCRKWHCRSKAIFFFKGLSCLRIPQYFF